MRLIRFGEEGRGEPGVLLEDGRKIDASAEFFDYDEGFFAMGGLDGLREWVSQGCPGGLEIDPGARIGPPVARPSKIVCVGQNYLEHAKEMGGEIPTEPVLFMKASSAWSGPNDDVLIPKGARKLDYEVELAESVKKRRCPMWRAIPCFAIIRNGRSRKITEGSGRRARVPTHLPRWVHAL